MFIIYENVDKKMSSEKNVSGIWFNIKYKKDVTLFFFNNVKQQEM